MVGRLDGAASESHLRSYLSLPLCRCWIYSEYRVGVEANSYLGCDVWFEIPVFGLAPTTTLRSLVARLTGARARYKTLTRKVASRVVA